MASAARQDFLTGLTAFRSAVDLPSVLAGDATGDFLRRGLTVAAYSLLESFVSSRLTEIAQCLNGGLVQFLDLPERLQKRAILNTLSVANNQLRWGERDLSDLRMFSERLGTNLRAVSRSLDLSPLTWLWSGSNMGADDYQAVLRSFHVGQPWDAVRDLAGRLGFPILDFGGVAIKFGETLAAFARERHRCAHLAAHGITSVWLRTVPDRVQMFAIAFDALVSTAAHELRSGNRAFLANDKWMTSSRVRFRFIRERLNASAEFVEGRARASAVAGDGDALFAAAVGRCVPGDVLVRQAIHGQISLWAVPAVD